MASTESAHDFPSRVLNRQYNLIKLRSPYILQFMGYSNIEVDGHRTLLLVTVMAAGRVLGEPEVRRSTGDPQFDDNAIRAVMGASPLPAPPSPGDWPFLFNPNE